MTNKYNETYALITGASGGLGKAFSEECAKRGMNLIIVALPDENLKNTAEYIKKKYPVKILTLGINLAEQEAPEKIYEFCQKNKLAVNMLINNAGATGCAEFEKSSLDYIELRLQLNIRAVVLITRLFIPSMKKLDKAYILNVASLSAFYAVPFKSVYSASKSFVLNFSKSLREELRDSSIKISILCPNGIKTNIDSSSRIAAHGAKGKIFLVSAEKIAEISIKKLLKGKKLIIPGIMNKLLLLLGKIIPEKLKLNMLYHEFKKELGGCDEERK